MGRCGAEVGVGYPWDGSREYPTPTFYAEGKAIKGATPFRLLYPYITRRGGMVGTARDYDCPCASDGIDVVIGQRASPAANIGGS